MASTGMLRRVTLISTDVLEERSTFIIRVTRIRELGRTLAVTSNRLSLRRRRYVLPKLWLLQEPHGVTSQQTSFFIVTAAKTSNLTSDCLFLIVNTKINIVSSAVLN
jgi:hypothetical protein